MEVLHLILCEEKAKSQAKTRAFFQFWGHKNLSVEVLHLILCEEKAKSQAKTRAFFSFGVIMSP